MYYWFMGKELFLKYSPYIEILVLLASIIIFFSYIKSRFANSKDLKSAYGALCLILGVSILSTIFYLVGHKGDSFWDINIVQCADMAFNKGINPYEAWKIETNCMKTPLPMQYTYLPLLLSVLPFEYISMATGEMVWVLFVITSIVLVCKNAKEIFQIEMPLGFLILLFLTLFSGINTISLQAANISFFVYLAILISSKFLINKVDEWKFYVILGVVVSVKFHMAAFILLPIIMDNRINFKYVLLFVASIGSIFLLNYLFHPNLLSYWVTNLGTVDVGMRPYFYETFLYSKYFSTSMSAVYFNYLAHVVLAPFLLLAVLLFRNYIKKIQLNDTEFNIILTVLSCMLVILILPRIKHYDFILISAVVFRVFYDSIRSLAKPDTILRALACLTVLIIIYSSIYLQPKWDNYAFYQVLLLFISYMLLQIRKIKLIQNGVLKSWNG